MLLSSNLLCAVLRFASLGNGACHFNTQSAVMEFRSVLGSWYETDRKIIEYTVPAR
jgi:hypothetical protein